MMGYPKDSMDRFGDDLTELILQYLTFEDKVRLECVSKQWRRLIYNKQFVIELDIGSKEKIIGQNELYLNVLLLESLLKKCPNISKVNLSSNIKNTSEVLSLIGQYCPNIKSLTYWSDFGKEDEKCLSFFRMYGHKLEELLLYGYSTEFRKISKFCPNVKTVLFPKAFLIVPDNSEYLSKLEHLINTIDISFDNDNVMKILSDKYSQTMKTLNVTLYNLTAEVLKTCFNCISRFENLRQLTLCITDSENITQPIDVCLSLIGQKCTKLLKLDLEMDYFVPISDRFFDVFTQFKAIKKLKIQYPLGIELNGSIECFKHCKQLNDIDINYSELREDFFANIASFVPKLQSLRITTEQQFSKTFVNSFPPMKSMKELNLTVRTEDDEIVYQKSRRFGKFNYSKQRSLTTHCIRFPGTILPHINVQNRITEGKDVLMCGLV